MNRIVIFALASFCALTGEAQPPPNSNMIIGSNVKWAQFYVDGQLYTGTAAFVWPQGSAHVVQFLNNQNIYTEQCIQSAASALQFSPDSYTVLTFGGWHDNTGRLVGGSDPTQTVTADPSITSLTASVSVAYQVRLLFYNDGGVTYPGPTGLPNCQAPLGGNPPQDLRPGIAVVGGKAYWGSTTLYLSGVVTLNAFPYPGFVFNGWSANGNTSSAYLSTVDVEGPMTLVPQFAPGKRVRFITDPMGLKVLVDHTTVPTAPSLDLTNVGTYVCPSEYTRPPQPPGGIPALCFGDFDFAPYSTHIIGAPTPQTDRVGKVWVFDSFDIGGGENTVYTTANTPNGVDVVTARFLPGAVMSFNTIPNGLPLSIDGRSNWPAQQPSITFTWAIGSTHKISAAPSVTDNKGRKYTFSHWSNNGAAAQDVTVSQSDVDNGARMVAYYDGLSRITVQSSPGGLTLQVDGSPCQSPCSLDRPAGSQVRITAPVSVAVSEGARLDFASWSDMGAADHVVTITGDLQITANYSQMYRLSATSDPANGATFQISPNAPDMYYPASQSITVTAQTNPGFRFRRWGGDLSGTYATGQVTITQPCTVVALLDKTPYIAPAGVQNAAGPTPDAVVAPGSIIAVFGASLTGGDTVVGPTNPLAQTLDGVYITVADRILPLLFVSPTQVNAQLPADLAEGNYTLTLAAPGQPNVNGGFSVVRNAPGLFTYSVDSRPVALAMHEDGTPISPDSPARQGETITVFGTGFGPTQQPPVAGFLLKGGPPNPLIDSVAIQLGDFEPTPVFSGASTDYIGMEVTHFKITPDLPSGTTLNLSITVNGRSSNTVQLPL